jgi:hypothetical protein
MDGGRSVPVVDGVCVLKEPGIYRAENYSNTPTNNSKNPREMMDMVAVAIPHVEGDVRHVPMPVGADGVAAEEAVLMARTVPLWSWILVTVLLLLAAESLIAGGIRKTRS